MVERGVGSWQLGKARTAVRTVINILKDGEWHRYQEMRKKTGLSSATLSKHLKELEKGVVEKKILLKSGEYPYPVVYRIREAYQQLFKTFDVPDARELGKKAGRSRKELEKETGAYLGSVNDALNVSVNEAFNVYKVWRNNEALQQTMDTVLADYQEAISAVQKAIDQYDEADKQVRAQMEPFHKAGELVSRKAEEALGTVQNRRRAKPNKKKTTRKNT